MNKVAVGIDIGGTNSKLGLADQNGVLFAESSISTTDYHEIDGFIAALHAEVVKMVENSGGQFEIVGVGIGAPNANYHTGCIENAANLVWKGNVPVVDKMRAYFPNIPVLMTNDANAAAIGEMIFGGAKGMKDFVLITLGTGVGSGFVANGEMIYGHDGFAGELGHTIIVRGGRSCGCGRKGCLETYTSAQGIKRTVFELLAERPWDSPLKKVCYDELTSEMIYKAAKTGDPLAIETFEVTGRILGEALADMVAITSPEAIFMFGGLARAGEFIFDPVRRHMEANLLYNYKGKVKVLPSKLEGKNIAVLGASALAWQAANR